MSKQGQYVAYYRVSTKDQGTSGLGLDAQREAVRRFVGNGGEVIAEYQDVESGKRDDREGLTLAIAESKRTGARLVIAKLDRLSRNAAFIFTLRDTGVNFVCADMPEANTLTVGIFATMAQHERELIASRTRAALQAKRERGEQLGTPANLTNAGRAKGRAVIADRARTNCNARRAAGYARTLRGQGLSLRGIAERLNTEGHVTPNGGMYHAAQVSRLLDRFAG